MDLEIDAPRALSHLRASDAELGRLIDTIGPFDLELPGDASTFTALAEAIVYQQLAPRAAATIFQRFCALFPDAPRCPTPEQVLGATTEALRAAGLSGAKERAVRDLAQRSVDGTEAMPTRQEVAERGARWAPYRTVASWYLWRAREAVP